MLLHYCYQTCETKIVCKIKNSNTQLNVLNILPRYLTSLLNVVQIDLKRDIICEAFCDFVKIRNFHYLFTLSMDIININFVWTNFYQIDKKKLRLKTSRSLIKYLTFMK